MELPPLAFSVSQLLAAGTGASRVHEVPASGAVQGGRVELVRIGVGALVRASLKVTIEVECSRCLAPLAISTAIAFDEVYEQRYDVNSGARLDPDESDPDAFTISQNHLIDITEGVRQYCEAAAPMQPLCRATCRGFCPSCGIDQNTGECACESAASDPRWAALAALKQSEP